MSHSDGCRCPDCYSLREHMLGVTGKDYGLLPAPNRRAPISDDPPARVLSLLKPCDGSYTCPCDSCTADKVKASGGPPRAFPWEEDFKAAA